MNTDIKQLAKQIAAKGRHGDTQLVHVSPKELDALIATGKITLNPDTGLPEAFSIGDFIPNEIKNAVPSEITGALNTIGKTATGLTGNPLGIPGFDLNMINAPTDVGHYAPVTKAAGVAGAGQLAFGGGGAPAAGGGGAAPEVLGSGLRPPVGAGEILGAGGGADVPLGTGITPGVASEGIGGGGLGTGVARGATGGLGALELSNLASADALGAANAGAAAGADAGAPAAAGGNAAGGLKMPGAAAQPGMGGGTGLMAPGTGTSPAAAGAQVPAKVTGDAFVDKILAQMKANPLTTAGVALMGANLMKRTQMPGQGDLQGMSGEARKTANQLMEQYRTGNLSAGQQASLDQMVGQTKAQLSQYFASIGQSDSTAHKQALAQVDQQALQMKQQMLDAALQNGLAAIGVATGPLNSVAQYQIGQDKNLQQAFGNFAGAIGQIYGSTSGKKA